MSPRIFSTLSAMCLRCAAAARLETEFLLRFQQFTSPVMAKGVEDTAFYCFNRMIGLNEVGGAPERDGVSLDEFHAWCAKNAGRASDDDEYAVNARHQTIRRRARAAGGADGDTGALAQGAASLVAQESAVQDRGISRSQHGVFSLSNADRRMADRHRTG